MGATEELREIDEKQKHLPSEELGANTLAQNSVDLGKSSFFSVESKVELLGDKASAPV